MVTGERLELIARIQRVRRWTRQGDVMAICDALERLLAVEATAARSAEITDTEAPMVEVTGKSSSWCPECAKRRDAKRQAQARYRKKQGEQAHANTQAA